jgi:hypothetical protein
VAATSSWQRMVACTRHGAALYKNREATDAGQVVRVRQQERFVHWGCSEHMKVSGCLVGWLQQPGLLSWPCSHP